MTAVLEVEGLSVRLPAAAMWRRWMAPRRFPPVEILSGIDLALEDGRTLGLLGESGSGKTTLARALIGLAPGMTGLVRVNGRAPEGKRDRAWQAVRREVGMIFQDPVASLDPRMTILASVAEPLAIHGGPGAVLHRDRWQQAGDRWPQAGRMLEQVGLPRRLFDLYPHQISGGQARRVAVARALVLRPRLVIADEPTAGLDVSVQGELLNLLVALQAELGLAYLLITHDLAVARHVSDRIAVMCLGRIVEIGSTEAVYDRPAHPYSASLLRPDEALPDTHRELPGIWRRPSGCAFHTLCPMVRDRCRIETPERLPVTPDHEVACHFPLSYPVHGHG